MSELNGRKKWLGWNFWWVIWGSGIHIYTYVSKPKTKPKKIVDFPAFLPFFLKLSKFPPSSWLWPRHIVPSEPQTDEANTTPTHGGLDAPPQAGRHTRLSFKALALALQGMLYVAVSYSILRIEDCNCYRIDPWRSGAGTPYHAILKGFLWYRESVSSISYLR